eukprot:4163901-Pyramimonas_sp.AAC.1
MALLGTPFVGISPVGTRLKVKSRRPVFHHTGRHTGVSGLQRAGCQRVVTTRAIQEDGDVKDTPSQQHVTRRHVLSLGVSGALLTQQLQAEAVAPFCGAFTTPDGRQSIPPYVVSLPWNESEAKYANGTTWYRVVGNKKDEVKAKRLPVMCIHGGPGMSARYMEPLELLASQNRRVILYDQFGCGFSSRGSAPPSPGYTLDFFMRELEVVRKYTLGLGDPAQQRFHLLGH